MKDLNKYTIEQLKVILEKLDEMIKLNNKVLELNKDGWDFYLDVSSIDLLGIIVSKKEEIVKELFFNRGVKFQ